MLHYHFSYYFIILQWLQQWNISSAFTTITCTSKNSATTTTSSSSSLNISSGSISGAARDLLYEDQQIAMERRAIKEFELLTKQETLKVKELTAPKIKVPLQRTQSGTGFSNKNSGAAKDNSKANDNPKKRAMAAAQAKIVHRDGVLRINNALSPELTDQFRAHVLDQQELAKFSTIEDPRLSKSFYGVENQRKHRCDLQLSLLRGGYAADRNRPNNNFAENNNHDDHDHVLADALQELLGVDGTLRFLYEHLVTMDGEFYELASVITDPGSIRQQIHPDLPYNDVAPLYVIFLALQDVDEHMGPTTFLLKTQSAKENAIFHSGDILQKNEQLTKSNSRSATLKKGDAVLFDARILHCGSANDTTNGSTRALFNFSFRNPKVISNLGYEGSIRPGYSGAMTLGNVCDALVAYEDGDGDPFAKYADALLACVPILECHKSQNDAQMTSQCTLLFDKLAQITGKTPAKTALTFISSKGSVEKQLTFSDVDVKSNILAKHLLDTTPLTKGDLCILVFPPGLDFLLAFLACLKMGVVAVPVYPPHPGKSKDVQMFAKVVGDCAAKYVLTCEAYNYQKKMLGIKQSLALKKKNSVSWPKDLEWIVVDSILAKSGGENGGNMPEHRPEANDLAFLQYTSGSTSDPKGVMITHGNLAHNMTIFTNELGALDDTVVCSWLPQYHDMGLIGSQLGILYCGGSGYYMSPISFLQRPMLWLECVSKYHGTHLQAPNFAFKLTARKFDVNLYDTASFNLSSVRHIINAAEPVDEASTTAFTNAFRPFGLRPDVIFPTYGLAEHTVFVCSGGRQILTVDKEDIEIRDTVTVIPEIDVKGDAVEVSSNATVTRRIVGCGYPAHQNVDVRIVNIETLQEVGEDVVGEIWVESPSKAAGYYNMPERTKAEFHAVLSPQGENTPTDSDDTYLRTGDLGFLHNKELFICGRLKDLIIIAGRNHFPQDLEASCEATSDALRPGCSAAFSIDSTTKGGDEEVVLIAELREIPPSKDSDALYSGIAEGIRTAVSQEHSLSLSAVVLLKPRTVPKTTSGKISRSKCRKAFLSKSLETIFTKSYTNGSASIPDGAKGKLGEGKESFEIEQQKDTDRTPDVIRNTDRAIIKRNLKQSITSLSGLPPESIDNDTAMNILLDSLNSSQLKGMIEHEFHVKELSDEYLFRESTTVNVLVEVIKLGYAPDDDGDGCAASGTAAVSQPVSSAGGLAGALGCPPGVCCTIM